METDSIEDFVNELIDELEKSKEIAKVEDPEHQTDEHEFYHEEIKKEDVTQTKDPINWKSANYHPNKN